jgi:hypothetical protein
MLSMKRCRSTSMVVWSGLPAMGDSDATVACSRTRPPRALTSM